MSSVRSIILATVFLGIGASAHAQSATSLPLESIPQAASTHLRIVTADGKVIERQFEQGQTPEIALRLPDGSLLPDGTHRWELTYAPRVSPSLREAARIAREKGDEQPPVGWPTALPVRSGVVAVAGGLFVESTAGESDQDEGTKSAQASKDQVIPDDLITQGSGCFGFDCINNENFGSDTLRLKENNLRIHFDDTSASGAFPANDWRLVANDSANGGANYLAVEDATSGRVPFLLTAVAPTGSIHVDSSGRVGFRTTTPVLDLQPSTGNTPALRLEQTAASGFLAQTWDVGANEANFFVRDVTNGSRLTLRIRPGAPTSSLDISADGDVGLGTASPEAAVHVRRPDGYAESLLLVDVPDGDSATEDRRLQLDADGNLFVSGSFTQLSSRTAKENFVEVAGDALLERLADLPVWTWNYLHTSATDRHIGPVAEDFYASFGFGTTERTLSPGDVAGVALAATKALQNEIAERDAHIARLEERLARLEAALLDDAKTASELQR
ncbi:MAG: tail fiber domain-containing protein [Lysobacteraceae bacterium]